MKKLFLFFRAAAIFGVGSAFTGVMMDTPSSGSYLEVTSGNWRPASDFPDADCIESPNDCSYQKIGNEPGPTGNPLQNSANFQVLDHGTLDLGI